MLLKFNRRLKYDLLYICRYFNKLLICSFPDELFCEKDTFVYFPRKCYILEVSHPKEERMTWTNIIQTVWHIKGYSLGQLLKRQSKSEWIWNNIQTIEALIAFLTHGWPMTSQTPLPMGNICWYGIKRANMVIVKPNQIYISRLLFSHSCMQFNK